MYGSNTKYQSLSQPFSLKNLVLFFGFLFWGFVVSNHFYKDHQKPESNQISQSTFLESASNQEFKSLDSRNLFHKNPQKNHSNSFVEKGIENYQESETEFNLLAWRTTLDQSQILCFLSQRKIYISFFSKERKRSQTALFILFHSWKFFLS